VKALVGLLSINSFHFFDVFRNKHQEINPVFFVPDYLDNATKSKIYRICKYEFCCELITLKRGDKFNREILLNQISKEFDWLFLYGTNHYESPIIIDTFKNSQVAIYEDGTLTYCEGVLSRFPRINELYVSNYLGLFSVSQLSENTKLVHLTHENVDFRGYRQSFNEHHLTQGSLEGENVVILIDAFYSSVPSVISINEELTSTFQIYRLLESFGVNVYIKWHPRRDHSQNFLLSRCKAVSSLYNLEETLQSNKDKILCLVGHVSTSMLSAMHYFGIPSIVIDSEVLFQRRIEKRPTLAKDIRREINLFYTLFPKLTDLLKDDKLNSLDKNFLQEIVKLNLLGMLEE